ncbi:MAG: YtxH protein [Segetibacter sp.]|nr:YtxH protein [Segetibacter sp.]
MNNSVKITLALLAVLAIGGFAGILLAPDKGEKTRDKISKKGKKLWKKTKETATGLTEQASNIKDKVLQEGEKLLS